MSRCGVSSRPDVRDAHTLAYTGRAGAVLDVARRQPTMVYIAQEGCTVPVSEEDVLVLAEQISLMS